MSKCFTTIYVLLSLLLVTGCKPNFNPLQENNKYHFSMNGYLDATADTQWVRVMPVRDSLFFSPKPIDATVTLEETGTGRSATLNDSLISYSQGTYAHNFWTTMDVLPEQTYRITVNSSDGQSSYAEVTLPEDFAGPMVDIIYYYPPVPTIPPTPENATIVVPGVERVADFQTVYTTADGQSTVSIPHLQDSVSSYSGDPSFYMDIGQDFEQMKTFLQMPPNITIKNYLDSPQIEEYVYIAAAGPGYRVNRLEVVPPEGISNVMNGVGYVAGIISKTVPFKSCYEQDGETPKPCPTVPPPW